MQIIPKEFFAGRPTAQIAREILGKVLIHASPEGITSGIIVEAEAYLSQDDPASHSARGHSKQNQQMYKEPGTSYIHLSYGVHYLVNAVCQEVGVPESVLFRALEPLEGLELMRDRRGGISSDYQLTNGPGKLTQAMGIDIRLLGHPLQRPPLYIVAGITVPESEIVATSRIGINRGQELPLRFHIKDNRYVSRG